jgi:FemAB-related protein (PEP-CTERM system-associated)
MVQVAVTEVTASVAPQDIPRAEPPLSSALDPAVANHPAGGDDPQLFVSSHLDAATWNHYVAARGSLFHRAEWESVWGVYGLKVYRLAVLRNQAVVGVLPLVHQRSRLTGNQLVSLPWFDAAGVLADDSAAATLLARAALELARQLRADWVQVRQASSLGLSPHVRTDKVLMRLTLEAEADALWNRLKAKVRNQIRKAEKSGLEVVVGTVDRLEEFYRVYSENMRDLGSPSHSRQLFATVLRAFPDQCRIYVVRSGQYAVGAGLTIANGSTMEIPWASSLKAYNGLCVNHLMYWRILAEACHRGFTHFHFGRSTIGSGQHHFKSQWGTEESPLHWYFLSDNEQAAFQAALPPQERLGWGTRLWRRMPLWLTRRLGPRLIAGIP